MSALHGRPKGRRRGFAKHCFAPLEPAGCAKPAVERKSRHGAAQRRTTVTPSRGGAGRVSRSTAPRCRSRLAVQSQPWNGVGGREFK